MAFRSFKLVVVIVVLKAFTFEFVVNAPIRVATASSAVATASPAALNVFVSSF